MIKDIYIATEDYLSEAVLNKIVAETGDDFNVVASIGKKGNGYLKKKVPSLVSLSPSYPVIILTDQDQYTCPVEIISSWLDGQDMPENLIFRIAKREVEAWLLADRKTFSKFIGTPASNIPRDPEFLPDPKQSLLNLANRYASRSLKLDLIADHESGPKQGFAYNNRLIGYVEKSWSPNEAAANAPSLQRAVLRIQELYEK